MPRRHGSARERSSAERIERPRGMGPGWAQVPGYRVQESGKEGSYTCPGCHQVIRPGTIHLVVVPDGDPDARRHWHTPCWQRELRRGR